MKKMLSIEDIEAQTALELPSREMMQLLVLPGGLVNVGIILDRVSVDILNNANIPINVRVDVANVLNNVRVCVISDCSP